MGEKVPPKEVQDEFLASRVPGTIIRSATPPARGWVSAMLHAYGRWGEFVGRDRHLMPDTGIEEAQFLVAKWTNAFIQKAKALFPGTILKFITQPGDHGFDAEIYEENEIWLKDLLKEVEED